MNPKKMPGAEVVRAMFNYDPSSGALTWKIRPSRGTKAGTLAGSLNKYNGYRLVRVNGYEKLPAHRIAWLHYYGTEPVAWIDHINGDRSDNRIANLRDVSKNWNAHNQRKAAKHNRSTGVLGVSRPKQSGGFVAKIRVDWKLIGLGTFPTVEMASEAYIQAKRRLHPGCTI